ncbi:MarR family winged helix-turn-helix transcriptional regulator [Streptomyces sp. Rer75]|uniref:MarR family winged helix-turn-helix transcriptional regulator n=1 Tax=unclassified Streptomyces TaxID=2593676 RepID=UPI0015D04015|nr:MarR family winged helix-turn-helix transcriptional regulator [Streptomyces sp. Rer75]QLH21607.1 winged helix-turn-helix transcriptional regulator [Streptomyces sp. Rer75]
MEFSHSDTELIRQPIGYWSWAASKAVVTYIREGLSEFGLSQPQWWTLNQVHDGGEDGRTRAEVRAVLQGYLDVGAALEPEIDALLDRGLLTATATAAAERLHLTPEGRALRARAAERQVGMRARIHDGIPDEDYVATLKVLQRMIHNTGGEAWHH